MMKIVLVRGKAICSASAAQFIADRATHTDVYDEFTKCRKYKEDIAHIYVRKSRNGLVRVVFADSENRYIVAFNGDPAEIPETLNDPRAEEVDIADTALEYIRKIRGFSQGELAKKSKVSALGISRFERGERDIRLASVDTVDKLAKALDTTIEELI